VIAVFPLTGTLINVATVLVGTALGTVLGTRLPDRIREMVLAALGLVTIVVGVDQGLEAFRGSAPLPSFTDGAVIIVLLSLLVGGVIGELLRIDDALNRFGEALKRRFGREQARFVEGFVVASLVFCVGPLTVLGAIQDGLTGNHRLLDIKSTLDGFAALAFASALGWGVGFSIVTILVYQGSLSLAASAVSGAFSDPMIGALTATGGVMIIAIGLRLLDLRQIRVANFLPALVLAPAAVAILEALR
jgi:uncharacterized protein